MGRVTVRTWGRREYRLIIEQRSRQRREGAAQGYRSSQDQTDPLCVSLFPSFNAQKHSLSRDQLLLPHSWKGAAPRSRCRSPAIFLLILLRCLFRSISSPLKRRASVRENDSRFEIIVVPCFIEWKEFLTGNDRWNVGGGIVKRQHSEIFFSSTRKGRRNVKGK